MTSMVEFPSVIRGNAVFGICVSVVFVMITRSVCFVKRASLLSLNDDVMMRYSQQQLVVAFFARAMRAFSSEEVRRVVFLSETRQRRRK